MKRSACLLLLGLLLTPTVQAGPHLVFGGKNFTESTLLVELYAILAEDHAGATVERRVNLGGTFFCFEALKNGQIDMYPEYTGTGYVNILKASGQRGREAVLHVVEEQFRKRWNLVWLPPLAFNNTYTLTVTRETAQRLGLSTITDLVPHAPSLLLGCTHEFVDRPDGLPGLKKTYGIEFREVRALDPGLTYRAARDGSIDVCDAYATDGRIKAYDLRVLEDDQQFFPPYQAAALMRAETLEEYPRLEEIFRRLGGLVTDDEMQAMNFAVDREGRPVAEVARDFLASKDLAHPVAGERAVSSRAGLVAFMASQTGYILELAVQHLKLTFIAVFLACLVGLPLGIFLTRNRHLATPAMMVINIIQTIPSLALLGFMIPLLGIGEKPAIVALFLYALLPIIRNTFTGISEVDPNLIEAARGIGMRPSQVLFQVELPLALPIIMAGVRTSTVINIGTATLAALIGAGGLGEPIFRGVASVDTNVILSGAIPAALLALLADWALGGLEKLLGPKKP